MSEPSERIKFDLDIQRVLEVLAAQIYPSPFALLRENTQNAYDAILLRKHKGDAFSPRIEVTIRPDYISIADNGMGMTRSNLIDHYWRAGSSSKNTPEARAAGVVGTFGIGAMANFGIAQSLLVTSESAISGEKTRCKAERDQLSISEDCIEIENLSSDGRPGTLVEARIQPTKAVNVPQAVNYLLPFVRYLPIDVVINGEVVSKHRLEEAVPELQSNWSKDFESVELGNGAAADVTLQLAVTGEVRVLVTNLRYSGKPSPGHLVLRQSQGSIQTLRSGFGLATVSVSSQYNLGGVADLLGLQPTAGREALTTQSMQTLQELIGRIEDFTSLQIASRPEISNSTQFMNWVISKGRYDLCGQLFADVLPKSGKRLGEIKASASEKPLLVYGGTDTSITQLASEERPILVLSRANPRRQCEQTFLRKFCKIEEISDDPKVLDAKSPTLWTLGEQALSFRVANSLSEDYFVDASVFFGSLSHGLPLIITRRSIPLELFLDPKAQSVRFLISIYEREYAHFNSLVKDFCRNVVFPKIADLVPSSTRQGAEAFLKAINRPREVFEYEISDLDSLPKIWSDYLEGKLSMQDAAERSTRIVQRSVQFVEGNAAAPVREVIPDVIENEEALRVDTQFDEHAAAAPIRRPDIETERKMLTIDESEPALRGYRCFLAISDRIHEEKGEFFLQPHRTSVVWGGQKAMFIFEHHSGEFGLYYDIQAAEPLSAESGGGSTRSCTIVMKNRIFVPVPPTIASSFLPKPGEKKRFEIRCDVLYVKR